MAIWVLGLIYVEIHLIRHIFFGWSLCDYDMFFDFLSSIHMLLINIFFQTTYSVKEHTPLNNTLWWTTRTTYYVTRHTLLVQHICLTYIYESRVFIENWLWVSQGCGSHFFLPWQTLRLLVKHICLTTHIIGIASKTCIFNLILCNIYIYVLGLLFEEEEKRIGIAGFLFSLLSCFQVGKLYKRDVPVGRKKIFKIGWSCE